MSNLNTDIHDRVINRAAMTRLYERRMHDQIESVVGAHEVRIQKTLEETGVSRKKLQPKLDVEYDRFEKQLIAKSSNGLIDLGKSQLSFAFQNVQLGMGKLFNLEPPTQKVASEFVLKEKLVDNKTLEAGWQGVSRAERVRLEQVIRKGISEGKTASEIAVDVRRGNVHKMTYQQSRALTVTAITSVIAQADHHVYSANGKFLQGWQYVAVLDRRTTMVCAHRDGKVFSLTQRSMLPPAHFNCRSTTVPVFKSWKDVADSESLRQIRNKNFKNLTPKQIAYYDGALPTRESYNDWLLRQPKEIQLRHLGDPQKVEMLNSGALTVDQFSNAEGRSIGIRDLRRLSDEYYTVPNDTRKFAIAKQKLDSLSLWATNPDDFINNKDLANSLKKYYTLQAGELDGTLSLINYRGVLIQNKAATKRRVLSSPPREDQLKFNPVTGQYEDVRLLQPSYAAYSTSLRLIKESEDLLDRDKDFIVKFTDDLENRMGLNERAVINDNLRVLFTRARKTQEPWINFKAVSQSQIKFDVMNVSDNIETSLRRDSNVLKRLSDSNFIDPVLGATQLETIEKNFIDNIVKKNQWEDFVAPKIAKELSGILTSTAIKKHPVIYARLSNDDLQRFYLKFAHRLSLADSPDRDAFAIALGRDLYNAANLNGSKRQWYTLGMDLLMEPQVSKFFKLETFGVQKKRMKSRLSGAYFGPYYDTLSYNLRIVDPRIQEYAKLVRSVDVGLRVGVRSERNRLYFREGYKTYFMKRGLGFEDTRIPITSTSSFSDFPEEFIDANMADALNWASQSKFKIDNDFYDFINKLLYFEDDKGKAKFYNDLNHYRKYIASRGDSYERFKSMEWLRSTDSAFSNHAFIDHRARIYDRGFISPQSGESFRPFLNTVEEKVLGVDGYENLQDQIGAFLGGLSDYFEGGHNSLTFPGRQRIAEKWRKDLVEIGYAMLSKKPQDIRKILEHPVVQRIDGEELGKFFRFAMEQAKIDKYLLGDYGRRNLSRLDNYKTALALEQDASSSGAQIIALTTRNKQLAELSNVIPTTQKRRLYDEIAARTFDDEEFRQLNARLGLSEKDLRKAAKAQNMVSFYGAGERTGILNVENKLSKALGKDSETLVVKASDRDQVLNEIDARIARVAKYDPETAEDLRNLRARVRDVFNKGQDPGLDILEQLYFLEPATRELVEKLSRNYEKVVTPDDFKQIAKIMSKYLGQEVPILRDFTRYFGRLAEDFVLNAKPSKAAIDWETVLAQKVLGDRRKGFKLQGQAAKLLEIDPNISLSENALKRLGFYKPSSTLSNMIYGVSSPKARQTGRSFFKVEVKLPTVDLKNLAVGSEKTLAELKILKTNKLPKSWTNIPWVNFDGKVIEQNFSQAFEERIVYKNADGTYSTNILQINQKTEADWNNSLIRRVKSMMWPT